MSMYGLIDLPWRTIATSHSTTRTCTPLDSQSKNNSIFHLWTGIQRRHTPTDQRTHITYSCPSVWIHQVPFGPLHTLVFGYQYKNQETMNLVSFSDYSLLTYFLWLTSWILHIIGLLHENNQYGMPQLQQYNFGQQTTNYTSSALP